MKGVREGLDWLLDALGIWLRCVTQPIAVLNTVLPEVTDDYSNLPAAIQVWVPSFLISLILTFPVLNLFGIAWDNLGFHLSNSLMAILLMLSIVFIAHKILVWRKMKSEYVRTLAMHTIAIAPYLPGYALLNLPGTYIMYNVIKEIKTKKQPIGWDTAVLFAKSLFISIQHGGLFLLFLSTALGVLSFGCLVIFAEAVSQWYDNNRYKTYSSIALAMVGSIILLLVGVPMQLFIIYSFVKVD